MKTRIWCVFCATALVLSVAAAASAQSIKLLAPGVGWMRGYHNTILWTSDGGGSWKDIAPPAPRDSVISSIFFLDPQHGWVLLARGEPDVPSAMSFELARTSSGGDAWSVEALDTSTKGWVTNGASLYFVDATHGWLGPLATSDGGRTWYVAHRPTHRAGDFAPGRSELRMVTREFGWAVGGAINDLLSVTRDGGKTWQQVVIPSPIETDQLRKAIQSARQLERGMMRALPSAAAAQRAKEVSAGPHDYYNDTFAHYSLPVFMSRTKGNIVVSYPGVSVLFATDDGGVTWKPKAHITGRVIGPSAVVDSTWITADVPPHGSPQLRKLGPGAGASAEAALGPTLSLPGAMSFITPKDGWVLTAYGRLLSTTDGGATWTDITPPPSTGGR